MTSQVPPFSISFNDGRPDIVDTVGRYATFRQFVASRNLVLHDADLRNVDLSGIDLSGADLRGTDFTGTNLSDAKLKEADLSGASLQRAKMVGADMAKANLSSTDLRGAFLRRANLTHAECTHAAFNRALATDTTLDGANMSHANLFDADFRGSKGRSVNFTGAQLTGADFGYARLVNPKFDNAKFSGFEPHERDIDVTNLRDDLWQHAKTDGGSYAGIRPMDLPKVLLADRGGSKLGHHLANLGVGAAGAALGALIDGLIKDHAPQSIKELMPSVGYLSSGATVLMFQFKDKALEFVTSKAKDKTLDYLKELAGNLIGITASDVHELLRREAEKRNFPSEQKTEIEQKFERLRMLLPLSNNLGKRLQAAFEKVGIVYHGNPHAAAQVFRDTDGSRIFICDQKDAILAVNELAKQEQGKFYAKAVIVNPEGTRSCMNGPLVILTRETGTHAVWALKGFNDDGKPSLIEALYDEKGELTQGFLNGEVQTPNFLKKHGIPARNEILYGLTRASESALRQFLRKKAIAERLMGYPSPETHVVVHSIEEKRDRFSCWKLDNDGKPEVLDNPKGPAIILHNAREKWYTNGIPQPAPGGIPEDFGENEPATISARTI